MKKYILCTMLAVCLTLALTACGKTTDTPDPQSGPTTNTADTPNTPNTTPLDIKTIADKSDKEVAAVLGDPFNSDETTYTLLDGTKKDAISCTYDKGTKVLFVDNKAVWITVYPPEGTTKVEDGASFIGLNSEEAGTLSSNDNKDCLWSGGLYDLIQAYNDGNGTIAYIDIITNADGK